MTTTKPNHPWNALPAPDRGDADPDVLYAAVGRALSAWENLESTLAWIFAGLCESRSEAPARAYGAVVSFNGRRDLLDEAFKCYRFRKDPELVAFPKWLEVVKHFSSRRNEIAHGQVTHRSRDQDDLGHYLVAAQYNSRKRPSRADLIALGEGSLDVHWRGAYAYTSREIGYYTTEFRRLFAEAMGTYAAIARLSQGEF